MNVANGQNRDMFVTVDEVASAQIQEMEAIYPVLNREKAKSADESFRLFIQNVFDKKVVSSVYLTGAAFENKWYPDSLKVLCNGRRAFVGDNLLQSRVPATLPCENTAIIMKDRYIWMTHA